MASSIRTTVHESLPYIDKDPTPAERKAAEALIAAEQTSSTSPSSTSSSSVLPPLRAPNFTPLLAAELERISRKEPLSGIDVSRYEMQDSLPEESSSAATSTLSPALARAYTTRAYLGARETHLRLLDAYGKNAWLVANWRAEADLAALERDLAAARRDVDLANLARRRLQDDVGEELAHLEDAWRRGVGRVLETEVATEALRRQVLERRRQGGM